MFRDYFKKADIFLFIAVLLIGLFGFVLLRHDAKDTATVQISSEGEIIKTVPLKTDGIYDITTEYGYNIIIVENGQVWVSEADCPGKDCMRFGKISRDGQVILCLPHRLVVSISNSAQGGPDAISY